MAQIPTKDEKAKSSPNATTPKNTISRLIALPLMARGRPRPPV